MPRQPRTAGEYLHIIVRGIGKQILFEDTHDREKYLSSLQKYAAETGISRGVIQKAKAVSENRPQ